MRRIEDYAINTIGDHYVDSFAVKCTKYRRLSNPS